MTGTVMDAKRPCDVRYAIERYGSVAVLFSTKWCGPCKEMKPRFNAMCGQGIDCLVRVDETDEGTFMDDFGIQKVPTIVLYRDKKKVKESCGAMDAMELRNWLKEGE